MPDEEVKDEEEESEEDDVEDEPPEDFGKEMPRRGRQSVSAEAYGDWNVKQAFTPPVIEKTDEQKDRLKQVLSASFLFASLDDQEFNIIIGAMKEVLVKPGERIINQKDDGDSLYVIEVGEFNCIIKFEDGSEKCVKTCGPNDVFGELALLYNTPRAASVESTSDSICWQLDRQTFNAIVKETAQNKRARYDSFLSNVPLLSSMDSYERSQLADALKVQNFADGATIVTQGDVGNTFYIIEEGAAIAVKDETKVMDYSVGDYFGELALIKNQARAATVMAQGATKVLSIDSQTFKRLLNVSDLEERAAKYT
jgi:cAMP-dependent protein kinase regulator